MNRIEVRFRDLQKNGKKAFVAFITAGYPNIISTEKLVRELDRVGVDIIELGVPFSDPMADGPIIQEASQYALKHKVHLIDILEMVKRLRKDVGMPICLMSYYNPIFCFGEGKFINKAKACGVDGVIIPDLPPEEAKTFTRLAKKARVAVINFISPTTTPERIKNIVRIAQGFIYYVSLTGVTGVRQNLPDDLVGNIRQIKKYTSKPVCVGFGVSNSKQVKQIYGIADGVIVGSAIVKKIKENILHRDLARRVGRFVTNLKK